MISFSSNASLIILFPAVYGHPFFYCRTGIRNRKYIAVMGLSQFIVRSCRRSVKMAPDTFTPLFSIITVGFIAIDQHKFLRFRLLLLFSKLYYHFPGLDVHNQKTVIRIPVQTVLRLIDKMTGTDRIKERFLCCHTGRIYIVLRFRRYKFVIYIQRSTSLLLLADFYIPASYISALCNLSAPCNCSTPYNENSRCFYTLSETYPQLS